MTRKQFFKSVGLNQNRDKNPFLDLIKKYAGRLSYVRMYMLIITAAMFGKSGEEIITYIEVIMDNERRNKK